MGKKKNSNRSHKEHDINLTRWKMISGARAQFKKEKKTQMDQAKAMLGLTALKEKIHGGKKDEDK